MKRRLWVVVGLLIIAAVAKAAGWDTKWIDGLLPAETRTSQKPDSGKPVATKTTTSTAQSKPATGATPARAPGKFDFYVLSLSWSPSYCEAEGNSRQSGQCDRGRPFAFVVHGLWPQYERGWPEDCPTRAEGPRRADVDAMLDIMPDPGLVRHEWEKHGTCSGLSAADYFKTIRAAFKTVTIPAAYTRLDRYMTTNPGDVEKAFLAANRNVPAKGIAIGCDQRRLREVRLCLTKDLDFRSCPEVDQRSCRLSSVVMPPVR